MKPPIMPPLKLEPDEILPTTPAPLEGEASGPFPLIWRGKERQFLLRSVEIRPKKHIVFACEVGNEAAGNWLLYERETLAPATWSPAPPQRKLENMALEFAVRGWGLGQIFIFPGPQTQQSLRLLFGEDGVGAYLHKGFRPEATFDFSPTIFDFDRATIRDYVNCERAGFNSTVSFAERWSLLLRDERREVVLGEYEPEIEQVMQWVLRCEPVLWECGGEWDWKLGPNTADFSYLFCPYTDNFENFAVNLPFIYAMGRFLVETHIPQLTKPLREKHRCVRDFLESETVWIRRFSEKPTAHEQLEAALNLRDWLRKHDAPAELLALLRF